MLLALGIHGYTKFVAASKTVEARFELSQIARNAVAEFDREDTTSSQPVIGLPKPVELHPLCPSASRSVPDSLSLVRGKKYASSPSEWTVDASRRAGFYCLKFRIEDPQFYMYSYRVSGGRPPSAIPSPPRRPETSTETG